MTTSTLGRPRDAAVSQALLEATLDLIAEEGFAGLTVDAIASRAGSGKPTVYRRWSSKEQLVATAIDAALSSALPVPDTGSLREDLLGLNREFVASFDTRTGRVIRALVAEAVRDDRWGTVLSNAQRASRARSKVIIERAVERGELTPQADGDLLLDLVAGPLWSHALVWRDIASRPPDVAAIVDIVLPSFVAKATKGRARVRTSRR